MKIIITIIAAIIVLLLTASVCYAQSSSITVIIADTSQIKFMDTIEAKLLRHIDAVQKRKIKYDITLYQNNYPIDRTFRWEYPLNVYQVQSDTLHAEKIATNTYQLSVDWNRNLDTGYVMGFSKMYYHKFLIHNGTHGLLDFGTYCWPLYEIPLNNYKAFLTAGEIDKIQAIIKQVFVQYINGYYYPEDYPNYSIYALTPYLHLSRNDSISTMTIPLKEGDSILPQFSLTYWGNMIIRMTQSELPMYADQACTNNLPRYDMQKIFQKTDTMWDENKHKIAVKMDAPLEGLSVCEQWKFENYKGNNRGDLPDMVITRHIVSLGINTSCYNDSCACHKHYATGWVKYIYVSLIPDLTSGALGLYKEVIEAPLYKRLDITYPRLR